MIAGISLVELYMELLALGHIVHEGLHGAGVVDQRLYGHPLLAAADAQIHVAHVIPNEPRGPLGRGGDRVKGLAEAALFQIVQRQITGHADVRRLKLVDLVADAAHGDVADAVRDKGRHAPVALAVFGQHLIGREHIVFAGGEIAVTEEERVGDVFLHDRSQDIGIKKIQNSHTVIPPYGAGVTALKIMLKDRSLSLSSWVSV